MKLPFRKNNHSRPTRNSASVSGWKSIASTAAILISAPILAIFITVYVFQSYEVFGMSMETTLQNGDRLIVQKLPKNWSRLLGNTFMPQRYEIVVFTKPLSVSSSSGDVKHLIKRVIGLPGDKVVISNGGVTIYNDEHPDGFKPDENQEYSEGFSTTPGNVEITVDEGEILVLGDNRTNSQDSRSFGTIKTDTITGTASLRFVPLGSFRAL